MKRMIALSLATVALTGAAFAQAEFEALDANADGMLTMDEMLATYPTMTEDSFVAIDGNADGLVDAAEFAIAMDGAMLPESSDG